MAGYSQGMVEYHDTIIARQAAPARAQGSTHAALTANQSSSASAMHTRLRPLSLAA